MAFSRVAQSCVKTLSHDCYWHFNICVFSYFAFRYFFFFLLLHINTWKVRLLKTGTFRSPVQALGQISSKLTKLPETQKHFLLNHKHTVTGCWFWLVTLTMVSFVLHVRSCGETTCQDTGFATNNTGVMC